MLRYTRWIFEQNTSSLFYFQDFYLNSYSRVVFIWEESLQIPHIVFSQNQHETKI